MEKKNCEEFLRYFRHLETAASIIEGSFYKPRIVQLTKEIDDTIYDFLSYGNILLKNVLAETESNLYGLAHDDRKIYLAGILIGFSSFSPYLNYAVDREYDTEYGKRIIKIDGHSYPNSVDTAHRTIIRHEAWYAPHLDDNALTVPEKYIIICFRTFSYFFTKLNDLLVLFSLDLTEIQDTHNIHVWQKDVMSISTLGFSFNRIGKIDEQIEQENSKLTRTTDITVKEETDNELKIKAKVNFAFGFMQGNDHRRHKQILNDHDFNKLVTWVSYYFVNNFSIPEINDPIIKVNTAKGNVVYTFMAFFKELHPASPRPDSLFDLIKACFHEYRDDKLENLKKTKEPQYYSDLIRKSK